MESSCNYRISSAKKLSGNVLELIFNDGYVGQVNLADALWGPVFGPLGDPGFFGQFCLEDGTIRWPNDADFCPNVLRYWCESGGVRSQEETDAYFEVKIASNANG